MKNEVIEYEEYGIIELFPRNDDDKDCIINISKEQLEIVNKILIDTGAKFIEIGDEVINVSSIRKTEKHIYQPKQDKYQDINISDEQREKNKQAIDKLREQLTKNKII